MWLRAILFGLISYALILTYGFFYAGQLAFAQFSEALAATGGFLIGSSFALSGMSYFFNFLDSDLRYRKYIGVCGYFFALAYSITLLIRFPEKYDLFHPVFLLEAETVFGLVAMGILTLMAIVSANSVMKLLGPIVWRKILHTGYFAYLLLIVRAYLVEHEVWSRWFSMFDTLPPPRLLLTIFAIGVLLLRFCMELSLRVNKKEPMKTVENVQPISDQTGIELHNSSIQQEAATFPQSPPSVNF